MKTIFSTTQSKSLRGPADSPEKIQETYKGVDCDFTDELEHAATLKLNLRIDYWDKNKQRQTTQGKIVEIRNENREEYLIVSSGPKIRLDEILSLEIIQ